VKAKILIVNDEKSFLDTIRRNLAHRYELDTAEGGVEGLKALQSKGPYVVIISDLSMPDMNGVKFLSKIIEFSPNTVRLVLTDHGDFDAVIEAVNEGHAYAFLSKPCSIETLIKHVDDALVHYRKGFAEKELLQGTLRGSIKVLVDVLNIVNPDAFHRGERIKRLMMSTVKRLQLRNTPKFELAGMLSQFGLVAVPQDIVDKRFHGKTLTSEENQIYRMHATMATTLISQIPRMNEIVEIIGSQLDCNDDIDTSKLSIGAALLNICLEYDDLDSLGVKKDSAMKSLRNKWEHSFPSLFNCFEEIVFSDDGYVPRTIPLNQMVAGMVLQQDIFDSRNLLIIANGQEISDASLFKLNELNKGLNLPSKIDVLVPLQN
jgi:ActR/RegA family two-component response regulator